MQQHHEQQQQQFGKINDKTMKTNGKHHVRTSIAKAAQKNKQKKTTR